MGDVDPDVLDIAATPAGVREAIDEFGRFSSAHGIPDDLRRRMMVALDELLSNVVRHGRPADGSIRVRFETGDDLVTLTVEDTAPAFNPLAAPAPDISATVDQRQPGGVGIAVVVGLLEDVRYERVDGRNRVTLVDRLSRRATHS
jgi:anti-sigma regulatory factor (Ser/Thr protein kinase)